MRFSLSPLRLALAAAVLTLPAFGAPPGCDRDCLRDLVTGYLGAMLTHNPAALPLATNVRFTEDGVEMKLGEGLWKSMSAVRGYREDFLDVRQGVAVSFVVLEDNGMPALFVLRLKESAGKITEIETQVTRTQKEGALFSIDKLDVAGPVMSTPPDKSQRMSRDDAIKAAEHYPAGLKIGSFVTVDAPFAPDAYRLENGAHTAGPGCARAGCENIKNQKILAHPAITSQVVAVDEESGVVLLQMNFGDTGSYGPGNSLHVFEAFKVYGGQIHAVEAFMKVMPANAGSGWDR